MMVISNHPWSQSWRRKGRKGLAEKEGFKPGMKEWGVMNDESAESTEPTDEVPLIGLGESELERLVHGKRMPSRVANNRKSNVFRVYKAADWRCTKPFFGVIPKATIYTFLHPPSAKMDKKHKQAGVMQSINKHCDASFCFFATRPDSNIDDFFMHENAKKSPFLSNKGKLRTFTKSQILACLPGRPAHRKKQHSNKLQSSFSSSSS